jgi:hypothetical protein
MMPLDAALGGTSAPSSWDGRWVVADTDLRAVIQSTAEGIGLRPRDLATGWTCWELRTLNRHRAVALWTEPDLPADVAALGATVRAAVARDFHISWWQGFAYGIVVDAARMSWMPDDVAPIVDLYNTRRGVLQWLVLVGRTEHVATAVHTWMETDLSPVYRATLAALSAAGYRVSAATRERSGLLRFLTDVSAVEGVRFPRFQDGEGTVPPSDRSPTA